MISRLMRHNNQVSSRELLNHPFHIRRDRCLQYFNIAINRVRKDYLPGMEHLPSDRQRLHMIKAAISGITEKGVAGFC
ncbi:hypothetical protein AOP6_1427 [Desulfuromonas sp. AOP6]|nr:hypothetical protein AOP6_1427 [Desulfuromonas sp. AOP6]